MGISARELAAATPATRDRYVDLLRVASLAVVVLGHWLMAAVTADGQIGNLLAVVPELQLVTWVFQVMPVFFFVGGFSHALAHRSRPAYASFLRARLQRLLRPTMVFVAVWGAAALVLQLAGADGGLTGVALRLVTQPLWFIGIYLAMVAFTPPLLRLHERWGWGAFAALAGGAVAVDVLRFAAHVPFVEFLNFAFVWLAVHQLGFLRADGMIRRPALLAGAGLVGAAALVALGPYPLSMVGMPGEKVSNMAPPTLALLCHGLWLVGAVELLRGPGGAARRPGRGVAGGGRCQRDRDDRVPLASDGDARGVRGDARLRRHAARAGCPAPGGRRSRCGWGWRSSSPPGSSPCSAALRPRRGPPRRPPRAAPPRPSASPSRCSACSASR